VSSNFTDNVLHSNPMLGLVVGVHLLAEAQLRSVLSASLEKPGALLSGQGPSFSILVNVCEAVGSIESDLARVLRALNSLRNKYAHRLSFEASKENVAVFLQALRDMKTPFFVSDVGPTERELAIAIAALSGWLEKRYGNAGSGLASCV